MCLEKRSGETVVVPAGWKHKVKNCMETMSINHNWIVPASLDLTWKCMLDEIQAVEQEMVSWGLNSYEIRESMLLGCFGLDVSSFFLMILVGMIHHLNKLKWLKDGKSYCKDLLDPQSWELWFDLGCMISIINSMLLDCGPDSILSLPCRLEATLGDKILASNALHLFRDLNLVLVHHYSACSTHCLHK